MAAPAEINLEWLGTAGHFHIESYHTEDQILQGLKRLRARHVLASADISFWFEGISWTERIRQEVIHTFGHYNDLGCQWSEASFFCWDPEEETNVHAHLVVRSPVTTKLFKSFFFGGGQTQPMEIELATSIAFLLKNEQSVAINNFTIGNEAMSVLADGLLTLAGSSVSDISDGTSSISIIPTPQELKFCYVFFSNDEGSVILADGLAGNKTLTMFGWDESHLIDSTSAVIVQGLVGHPSLNELSLGDVEFGELTTGAICALLASPTCKVSDLRLDHLTDTEGGAGFDLRRFIDPLPTDMSVDTLRKLLIYDQSMLDHDSANHLLRNLWKLPSLKCLDLTSNSILNLVRLTSGMEMTTTMTMGYSRLRELHLDGNIFDFFGEAMSDEHPSTLAILNLLGAFPELGYLGRGVEENFPASVQERLDLNRCSGMLLRGAGIPLSVWAVVLAKVNSDKFVGLDSSKTSRRANVIYKMLQGPVFGGRGPLDR